MLLVVSLAFTCPVGAQTRAGDSGSGSTTTLKVDVRLVPVRAVVRDAHGKAVGNLTKEDFLIFDNGKPQVISQFSAERYDGWRTEAPEGSNPEKVERNRHAGRYTVYLFDDLHLDRIDLAAAREAAGKHLARFSADTDRVAIFTTSGQRGIDFTADHAKLRDVLLHLEPRGRVRATDCPAMTYFMADLIVDKGDEDALNTATTDALQCAYDGNKKFLKAARQMAQTAAREETGIGRIETQSSLRILKDLVQGMAKAPGERTIVVVSPGFFIAEDPAQVDVIDNAVRENITINTLDPRGLVPATDVTQRSTPSADKFLYKSLSDTQESAVLAELADATGGVFFRNNNDVDEGFRRTAATAEYSYVLAFSPQDVKFDGRLHKLKVSLTNQPHLMVQARKGYYAPKPGRANSK
jgi:VWFA-related protein